MADETPEQIRGMPDYIANRALSVTIIGWGAPFTVALRPDGARSIVIQRWACVFGANPFPAGDYAALGIFPSQQSAEAAAAQAAQLASVAASQAYAHYTGPEGVILPTVFNEVTTPNLIQAFRALTDQEGRDAQAARNLILQVFLTAVGLRGVGAARGVAPGAGRVPGPPAPQQLSAVRSFYAALRGPWRPLTPAQMAQFLRELWARYPLLARVRAAQNLSGPAQVRELEAILQEFSRATGVVVRRVPTGSVQAARGSGNLASLRVEEGVLQIEEQVFQNAPKLMSEVRHEVAFYFSNAAGKFRIGETGFQALDLLEMTIESGLESVTSIIGG